MKTKIINLFNTLNYTAIKDLAMAIKENNETGHAQKQHNTFSSAELWNIQRQRRSLHVRRGFSGM